MRETASLASSFERQRLPAGLMQRLEMMQQLALQATAPDGRKPQLPAVRRLPRPGAQVIVMAWFSLGVMASGAAGAGALLGLRALEARGTPLSWASVRASLGTTLASAWAKMPPVAFAPGSGAQSDGPWERVEVKIDPARRALRPAGAECHRRRRPARALRSRRPARGRQALAWGGRWPQHLGGGQRRYRRPALGPRPEGARGLRGEDRPPGSHRRRQVRQRGCGPSGGWGRANAGRGRAGGQGQPGGRGHRGKEGGMS